MTQSTLVGSAAAPALAKILGKYLSLHTIDMIEMFLISFVVWNILNIIVFQLPIPDSKLPRNDYLDLRNRITSFIHGFIILILSGYNTYFVHSSCGENNTRFEEQLMAISGGYFTYDLVAMIYLRICDRSMFIHHTLCISGLISGLVTGFAGEILVCSLFLTEISNPPMHLRVIFKHLGLRYTKAYESAEIIYICKSSKLNT